MLRIGPALSACRPCLWVYGSANMGTHMKTTVEISDGLLAEAKKAAAAESTTLRELIEMGLRAVLAQRAGAEPFRLRDASVDGGGLRQEFAGGDWSRIRETAYEGRGG